MGKSGDKTRVEHSTIRTSAETELANVMRVDEEERDIVSQFFSMLGNKDWRHATHSDGTDIFKLPGERIHRIMGVTRCNSTPEEVLHFFSEPKNFKKNFSILDAMFKDGQVVKVGGDGLELDATGPRQRSHKPGNFAALSIGGKDRTGPPDPNDLADGAIGYFSKLRRSPTGRKLEAFIRRRKRGGAGVASSAIAELPSSQDTALTAALTASTSASTSASFSAATSTTTPAGGDASLGPFKDRPGHALLHGTFRLPSVIPDRDFIWDQVAMRLPTGSVLIAGRSVDDAAAGDMESYPPLAKGHVRGAVLTSGYYIVPDAERGSGSWVHFVVQADPRGSLPAWVVNLVAPKQAHNVSRLRDHLDAGGQ
mmetsp:Transcript_20608/g.51142  ORF Transcript_20608/g.51142 Transcript_20608/m.51142 type:complete len:367 (-) Transcript_20608:352-1452(-)